MTHERLVELLSAAPELTMEEVNRLRGYKPKLSILWLAVQFANSNRSMGWA